MQGIEALGPYPILQLGAAAIALIVVGVGSLLWLRGERVSKASDAPAPSPQQQPAVQLYFDGPLKAIFETLNDIKGRQLVTRLESKDDVAVLLSNSRNAVLEKMTGVQAEIVNVTQDMMRDHEAAMENRFRDVLASVSETTQRNESNINSLHARMDSMLQMVARIEATMMRRRQ